MDPEKKVWTVFSLPKYGIPKSLKPVCHWLSKTIKGKSFKCTIHLYSLILPKYEHIWTWPLTYEEAIFANTNLGNASFSVQETDSQSNPQWHPDNVQHKPGKFVLGTGRCFFDKMSVLDPRKMHSRKLTWIPKMMVWKMVTPFKWQFVVSMLDFWA